MTDLEKVLMELRSKIEEIAYPIQLLRSVEKLPEERYIKLYGALDRTQKNLIDLLDTVPASPFFISKDPNFILYLRHDMRAPLSVLISAATIIEQLHGADLNAEQHEAMHTIEHIANDLINYLNTFD